MGLMNNYEEIMESFLRLLTKNAVAAEVVALVLAVLICFLGVKIFKIWTALIGLLGGFILGFWVPTEIFHQRAEIGLAAGAVVGIIFAVVIFKIYIVGVMLCSFIFCTAAALVLIRPADLIWFLVCVGIGIVLALISIKFPEPMVIFATSLAGGLYAGNSIAILAGIKSDLMIGGIGLVLAGIGLVIQFILEGKKRGRQAVATAKTIQSEKSIENEIEAARAVIWDEDEE